MKIVFESTFERTAPDFFGRSLVDYSMLVATDVRACLFGDNEHAFDIVYHLYVLPSQVDSRENQVAHMLYRPRYDSRSLVTVFKVPPHLQHAFKMRVGAMFQTFVEGTSPACSLTEHIPRIQAETSGLMAVYMKSIGDDLWAFVVDAHQSRHTATLLNPQTSRSWASWDYVSNDVLVQSLPDCSREGALPNLVQGQTASLYNQLVKHMFLDPVDTGVQAKPEVLLDTEYDLGRWRVFIVRDVPFDTGFTPGDAVVFNKVYYGYTLDDTAEDTPVDMLGWGHHEDADITTFRMPISHLAAFEANVAALFQDIRAGKSKMYESPGSPYFSVAIKTHGDVAWAWVIDQTWAAERDNEDEDEDTEYLDFTYLNPEPKHVKHVVLRSVRGDYTGKLFAEAPDWCRELQGHKWIQKLGKTFPEHPQYRKAKKALNSSSTN